MEHLRTDTHKYCDIELCCIIDTITGEIERAFPENSSVGTLKDGLDWLVKHGSKDRYAIIKLNCIGAFHLNKEVNGFE